MATVKPAGHHHPDATAGALLLFLLLACPTLQHLHVRASPLDLQLTPRPRSDDDFFQIFLTWILEYGRVHSSFLEQQRRFTIFRDNLIYILDINEQEGLTYELGLNNFTDVTHDEFQEHYLGLNPEPELARSAPAATAAKFVYADVEPKEAVDWRDEGVVTSRSKIKANVKSPSGTVVHIDDMALVPLNSDVEENLLKAVTKQPVSVGIDVLSKDFQHYKGSISNGDCWRLPNHAILIVGYGTSDDGKKYWILKNPWGTSWGEKDFFRLLQETDGLLGKCSIHRMASFPTIKDSNESRSSI